MQPPGSSVYSHRVPNRRTTVNEIHLNLTVAVDHDLDNEGLAELIEVLQEHVERLYDEPGPQQSFFSSIKLLLDTRDVY